ncbi:Exosome complex exonuclease RRP4, partial [Caligus rogercresseyi]
RPSEAVDPDLTFVTPGDVITRESGFMRGHGTYAAKDEKVMKISSWLPWAESSSVSTSSSGEIGDVLVGRISEVQQRRWKVDVNSRLDAVLQLSRRSSEDELAMRSYLREGDLISAEVQTLYKDGS